MQPNRHNVTFKEWIDMDLEYIDNQDLQKDANIFIQTVKTMIIAGGH